MGGRGPTSDRIWPHHRVLSSQCLQVVTLLALRTNARACLFWGMACPRILQPGPAQTLGSPTIPIREVSTWVAGVSISKFAEAGQGDFASGASFQSFFPGSGASLPAAASIAPRPLVRPAVLFVKRYQPAEVGPCPEADVEKCRRSHRRAQYPAWAFASIELKKGELMKGPTTSSGGGALNDAATCRNSDNRSPRFAPRPRGIDRSPTTAPQIAVEPGRKPETEVSERVW